MSGRYAENAKLERVKHDSLVKATLKGLTVSETVHGLITWQIGYEMIIINHMNMP